MVKKSLALLFFILLCTACEEIFEVADISDEQVQLLAPVDQSVLTISNVSFNWNSVDEANSYEIQIATPSFLNAQQIIVDTILSVDSTYVGNRITLKLSENDYEWRVKAMNSGFETDYSLSAFTVDLVGDAVYIPNTPELISPANGAELTQSEVMFSWSRVDVENTQEQDSIYVHSTESLDNLVVKGLGVDKSFTQIVDPGTYYWYVRAFNENGTPSDASETFMFTIVGQ